MRRKILSLLCCFQLLFAGSVFAQSARVSISKNNVRISQILSDIEQQTDYLFVVNNQVDVNQMISVDVQNLPVSQLLDQTLGGMGIAYKQEGTHIVLSKKEEAPRTPQRISAIAGEVFDSNGAPITGALVLLSGTNQATTSDTRGQFSINASPGQVLQISMLGFTPVEVTVGSSPLVSVVMKEDNFVIDNVVVTALGIKRAEKALSYNVQELKSEDVTAIKDANFVSSLAGKIAGVTINSSSTGTGGATRVVMRGTKSITKDNNALYVIDGVPMISINNGALDVPKAGEMNLQTRGESISDINPEDIESMTALTGAAAAALYGSSAANGAIIITTKRGKAGRPEITLSNQTTFSAPVIMYKFQDNYINRPGEYSSWGDRVERGTGYDPKKFFNTGSNTQTSFSLSGGTDKNQTYLSLSNTTADGIIPTNEYNRNTITFRNTTSMFNDKLTIDVGVQYAQQDDRNMIAQGQYYNPLIPVYTYPRGENFSDARLFEVYNTVTSLYEQNWKWGAQTENMQNPYWILNRNVQTNKRSRTILNISLKYDVTNWLNITARARNDRSNGTFKRKLHASTLSLFAGEFGAYRELREEDRVTYGDIMANINKRWNKISLTATVGGSINDTRNRGVGANGDLRQYPNIFMIQNIDMNPGKGYPMSEETTTQEQSVFASAEVGFADMVYLSATHRIDWASQLAYTNVSSFQYPSVGLSVLIHEMVKMPSFIPFLKLRGSFASVGSPIPAHLTPIRYEFIAQTGNFQQSPIRYHLTDYKPERSKSWEVGMQVYFFGNKLSLDGTYYKTNTYNQTFNAGTTSSGGGGGEISLQTGNVQNQGVELALTYRDSWAMGLAWESSFIASHNKNKIKKLVKDLTLNDGTVIDDIQRLTVAGTGSLEFILTEGGSMGDMYTNTQLMTDQNGYVYVDPETGNLASENLTDPVKVGSVFPKWNLSWRNGFTYRGFNLDFMFSARLGGVVASPTQAILDGYGVSQASADARDAGGVWINNGYANAETFYKTVGAGKMYSYYIYSATNVRLQELSFGYDFPSKWFKDKMRLKLSVVGRNLWMIYCKAPFDPELTSSTGTYYQGVDYFMQPGQRTMGFNVQLKF